MTRACTLEPAHHDLSPHMRQHFRSLALQPSTDPHRRPLLAHRTADRPVERQRHRQLPPPLRTPHNHQPSKARRGAAERCPVSTTSRFEPYEPAALPVTARRLLARRAVHDDPDVSRTRQPTSPVGAHQKRAPRPPTPGVGQYSRVRPHAGRCCSSLRTTDCVRWTMAHRTFEGPTGRGGCRGTRQPCRGAVRASRGVPRCRGCTRRAVRGDESARCRRRRSRGRRQRRGVRPSARG